LCCKSLKVAMSVKKTQRYNHIHIFGKKIQSDKSSFGQTGIESLSDPMSGKFFSSFAKPVTEF
jgi:hypothetical protein